MRTSCPFLLPGIISQVRSKAGAPLTPSPHFAILDSSPDSCRSLLQGQEWGGKCCEPCGCAIVKSTAVASAALGLGAGWRRRASVLTARLAAGRRGPLQGSLGSSKHHPHCLPPRTPLLSQWQMVLKIQGIDKKTVRARKGSSPSASRQDAVLPRWRPEWECLPKERIPKGTPTLEWGPIIWLQD